MLDCLQGILTQEQFDINRRLVKEKNRLDGIGSFTFIGGLLLALAGVVAQSLIWGVKAPMEEPITLSFIGFGLFLAFGVGLPIMLWSTRSRYYPRTRFTLLACPHCGRESPRKEFPERTVTVKYD